MEADAWLDIAAKYTEWVDPTDADYATRRAYWLELAQEVFDEVWNYRPWPFKLASANVTVNLGFAPVADLPADFQEFGEQGRAYLVGSPAQPPLDEVSPQLVQSEQNAHLNPTSLPDHFAVFGFNTSTATYQLQMPPLGANITLLIWYYRVGPTLTDAATSSGMTDIPAQYHRLVLVPGLIAKLRKAKGDDRDWRALYLAGLAQMVVREKPRKSTARAMPRSIIKRW